MEKPIAAAVVEPEVQRKKINFKRREVIPPRVLPKYNNIEGYLNALNADPSESYAAGKQFILLNRKIVDLVKIKRKQREVKASEKRISDLIDSYLTVDDTDKDLEEARIERDVELEEKKLDKLREELLTLLRGDDIPAVILEEEGRRPSKSLS